MSIGQFLLLLQEQVTDGSKEMATEKLRQARRVVVVLYWL